MSYHREQELISMWEQPGVNGHAHDCAVNQWPGSNPASPTISLDLSSAVHALIGYVESLSMEIGITQGYIDRLRAHYIPNVLAAMGDASKEESSGKTVEDDVNSVTSPTILAMQRAFHEADESGLTLEQCWKAAYDAAFTNGSMASCRQSVKGNTDATNNQGLDSPAPANSPLPCPFCGGEAIHGDMNVGFPAVFTFCQKCGAASAVCAKFEAADRAWNSRVYNPASLSPHGDAQIAPRNDVVTPEDAQDGGDYPVTEDGAPVFGEGSKWCIKSYLEALKRNDCFIGAQESEEVINKALSHTRDERRTKKPTGAHDKQATHTRDELVEMMCKSYNRDMTAREALEAALDAIIACGAVKINGEV